MKIAACLVICLTILHFSNRISGQQHAVKSKGPIGTLLKMMKRCAVLMYRVHKYVINVDQDWSDYAKLLIERQKKSGELKGMTVNDVDKIFQSGENILCNLTIFKIELLASGPDLFTRNNAKWKFERVNENGELEDFIITSPRAYLAKSKKPVLTSLKEGFSFKIILGPAYSETENVHLTFYDEHNRKCDGRFALSDPVLDIIMKRSEQIIRYSIIVHKTEINGVRKTRKQKYEYRQAIRLVRGITSNLLRNIDRGEPQKDLGADYRFYSKTAAISFLDDNAPDFIRRWVRPISETSVELDLYGAVKEFLRNPSILTVYGKNADIRHDHHKTEVENFENRIFYQDKFPDSNIFEGFKMKANFKPRDEASRFILDSLKRRANEIRQRVENEGLEEKKLANWQNWIEKMIKKDFLKHRELSGIKHQFDVVDRHFTARRKDKFEPYYRKFGPPSGSFLIPPRPSTENGIVSDDYYEKTKTEIYETTTEPYAPDTEENYGSEMEEQSETAIEQQFETSTEECETATEEGYETANEQQFETSTEECETATEEDYGTETEGQWETAVEQQFETSTEECETATEEGYGTETEKQWETGFEQQFETSTEECETATEEGYETETEELESTSQDVYDNEIPTDKKYRKEYDTSTEDLFPKGLTCDPQEYSYDNEFC